MVYFNSASKKICIKINYGLVTDKKKGQIIYSRHIVLWMKKWRDKEMFGYSTNKCKT